MLKIGARNAITIKPNLAARTFRLFNSKTSERVDAKPDNVDTKDLSAMEPH